MSRSHRAPCRPRRQTPLHLCQQPENFPLVSRSHICLQTFHLRSDLHVSSPASSFLNLCLQNSCAEIQQKYIRVVNVSRKTSYCSGPHGAEAAEHWELGFCAPCADLYRPGVGVGGVAWCFQSELELLTIIVDVKHEKQQFLSHHGFLLILVFLVKASFRSPLDSREKREDAF